MKAKRPPEMVPMDRYEPDFGYCYETGEYAFMALESAGDWVNADAALAAIRSLRVKLFRERAKLHQAEAAYSHLKSHTPTRNPIEWLEIQSCWERRTRRHLKANCRFSSIADAIERGER
jgi:hypothetical protein